MRPETCDTGLVTQMVKRFGRAVWQVCVVQIWRCRHCNHGPSNISTLISRLKPIFDSLRLNVFVLC